MADYNPNYVGGDISAGANTARQIALRPRLALNPLQARRTGCLPLLLCHSPGAGVHGMCGYNAAQTAIAKVRA